jgi:RNA polymerase-binding transcription factor DksA
MVMLPYIKKQQGDNMVNFFKDLKDVLATQCGYPEGAEWEEPTQEVEKIEVSAYFYCHNCGSPASHDDYYCDACHSWGTIVSISR